MKIYTWVKAQKKKLAGAFLMLSVMMMTTISAFAATGDHVAITSSDLEPILQAAKDNIGVIVPVAIGLFAILLGIGFVPMLLKKFKKG